MTNPDLHADLSSGRVGFGEPIINMGLQCVERSSSLFVLLSTRKFGTAETARAMNLDAFRTQFHRNLNRFLHRAAEADTAFQLLSNTLSDKLSIRFRLLDLDNIENQLFALGKKLGNAGFQRIKFRTLASNQDAGTRRIDP